MHPYRSPASPLPSTRKVERGCYVRIIEGGSTGIVLFLRGRHVHVKIAGVPPRYECFRQSELERLG